MELAKYISETQQFIFINEEIDENEKNEELIKKLKELRDEFPYEVMRTEPPELEEGQDVEEFFLLEDDKVVQHYKVVSDIAYYQRKIDDNLVLLDKTDYKTTKCYEYFLAGKQLPYDINALHEERQMYRDEINRLKELIK
ncbi:MAG: hypothetical protein BWY95_01457 [Bacteroidetes bacterium ADurb.BinA104]|nr:MAG: hypothetical protein BWY95_01457 [Bacteroidetes bacterium ADurb.BinA104]